MALATFHCILRGRGGGCAASKPAGDEHAAHDGKPPGMQPNDRKLAVRSPSVPRGLVQELDADGDLEIHTEVMNELRKLDAERLLGALQRADIRLLRTAWLREQPPGFLLLSRQELEEIEKRGTEPSPLLSPDESVALIQRANRSAGILSHGWLLAAHCDPGGARAVVVLRALRQLIHLEGLFWDYGSMYQNKPTPRTPTQNEAFKRAIDAMGDLCASAVGTCVLQHKEIPARPSQYDGALQLGGVPRRSDENTIRAALGGFGEIVSCEMDSGGGNAVVRFATHCARRYYTSHDPRLLTIELTVWTES